MKSAKLLILAAALFPAAAHSAQTLLEAYELAVERDPQLAAARAQREAEQENIVQARSLFLPQIGLEASAARVQQDVDYGDSLSPQFADRDSRFDTTSAGVQLVQPLFRMESFTLYQQAQTLVQQADLELALARQSLTLRLAEAYFNVLQAQDALQTYEAELAAIEQQLLRAKRAYEIGAGTITDVNEAQARYDLTVAQRLSALNQLKIARERLLSLTGADQFRIAGLVPSFQPAPPQPAAAESWGELAAQKNLQVLLAEAGYALATDEVDRMRAGRYPQVDLVASYGRNHQGEVGFQPRSDATEGRIGVNLSMPLYTGGAVSSQIRQAKAEQRVAYNRLLDAKREAVIAAESAYLELQSAIERVQALEQALRSIKLSEESTRRGVELGLRTTLDLLDIQGRRYAAERDLAAARYSYLLSYLQLQATVGNAVEGEAVALVSQYLQGD